MAKVLLLGDRGMLGHAIRREFARASLEVTCANRSDEKSGFYLDAKFPDKSPAFEQKFDYIINAIGIIKPYIDDKNSKSVQNAIKINSIFPYFLEKFSDTRIIQIATDCVYSGLKGNYFETDSHDPLDVYGKTKSLGEVNSENFMNIRCSIIGPELGRSTSLWEWVSNQPLNAEINGFSDHKWNGVTTKAFGQVVLGIIRKEIFRPGSQHLIPKDVVSKFDLVTQIAAHVNRKDIRIKETESGNSLDRTLNTKDLNFNRVLWESAGFKDENPAIHQLISQVD